MLASVLSGWGFQAESNMDKVKYTENPEQAEQNYYNHFNHKLPRPIHGFVNGNMPAVIPLEKNICYETAGSISGKHSIPAYKIKYYLEQALCHSNIGSIFTDEKIRLALELWLDYHKERNLKTKFLILVMALEVLAPSINKHLVAQKIIERWRTELNSELRCYEKNSEEYEALESLNKEVLFRRERSIRGRIRKHVLNVVGAVSPDEAHQTAKLAVDAYDLRSRLQHTGTLKPEELTKGHFAALEALRMLLLASFGVPKLHTNQ